MPQHADRRRRPKYAAGPRLESLEGRRLMSAGDLDATFNGSGMQTVDVQGNGARDQVGGVAIQAVNGGSDTLVVGSTPVAGVPQPYILRLTPSGALDSSFAGGGKQVVAISKTATHFNAVAVLPNGSFLAVGDTLVRQTPSTYDAEVIVARFTADGRLDTTFGSKGVTVTNLNPGIDSGDAVAVQPDGKFVVAGLSQQSPDGFGRRNDNGFLARYTASGKLDASFGSGGVAYVGFDAAATPTADQLGNVTVQTDASGAVASYTVLGQASGSSTHAVVVRLTASGARMSGWGAGNGRVDLAIAPSPFGSLRGLAVDHGGRVIVAGNAASGLFAGTIAALTPQGVLDASFTNGDPSVPAGYVRVAYPTSAGFDDVAIDAANRVVVSGLQQVYSDIVQDDVDDNIQVFRFLPTGQQDVTFGSANGGYGVADATPAAGSNSNEHVAGMALQPDGRAVVVGTTSSGNAVDVFVARFQGDAAAPATRPLAAEIPGLATAVAAMPGEAEPGAWWSSGSGRRKRGAFAVD